MINEGGTAHRWPVTLLKNGSPPVPDAEQNLFLAALYGIDTCDMHAAVAPRPLLALIEEYAEPFNRSAAHIRARYELLNSGDRFETAEAKARHAWTDLFDTTTGQTYLAWSLDQDLFGMRVADILRGAAAVPKLLGTSGRVSLCAWGDAAAWALCAAAHQPAFCTVVCHEGLVSWRVLLSSDRYSYGTGVFVRGIFPHYDLPQIAGAIAPRRLVVSSPAGAMRQPVSPSDHLAWTRSAYTCCGAQGRFLTPPPAAGPLTPALLARWLT